MNELDLEFIEEALNMRMEIAFKKMLRRQTNDEKEQKQSRDDEIDTLYDAIEKECTEEGRKLLHQYADEVAYRESDDADFYYKSGFVDGIALIVLLQKIAKEVS